MLIRFFTLLFISITALYALSNIEILKRADNLLKSNSSSKQFRAYNDYKNIYLRAMLDEDMGLRIKSLKGIVKSGKKLHIDVDEYSKELKQRTYKRPPTKKTAKRKNYKLNSKSSHSLKSIKWQNSKLVLSFDKKLRNNQINYFTLYDSKKNRYRYIFDIHAKMDIKSKTLKNHGVKRINIARYRSNTLRLVIENNSKIKISFYKKNKQLFIRINSKNKFIKVVAKPKAKVKLLKIISSKIIVIDAGHGGKDPGATGYKRYREKVVVFKIAKELKKILNQRGYKVYMTRSKDKFVKLANRTKYANKKNADIFVSIHANAVNKKIAKKVTGIECYFLSPSRSKRAKRVAAQENSADMSAMNRYGKNSYLNLLNHYNILASNKLAIDLQRGMLGLLNKKYKHVKDGGVREGPFWVLVGAQMPSVLVEVGFISNPSEAKRLVDDNYRKTMAEGLANGIERYFAKN